MSYFVNAEEKKLLEWVKENKSTIEKMENDIPTATAVEAYDDSKLTAQLEANRTDFLGRFRRLDERVTTIEKEEKEEKVFFKEIEDRIEKNKDGIYASSQMLAKAMKDMEAKQQKEITDRMKEMEAKQQKEITDRMNEMKEMQLKLELMNGELNRKVTSVLDARQKVLNPSG
jgi:tetrahydromethanopterin S-methyltransferase subunit A